MTATHLGRPPRRALPLPILLFAMFLACGLLRAGPAAACACGCGVFDVGAGTFFPNDADHGLATWVRFSGQDQTRNWAGTGAAPATNNADRTIRTQFYTVGAQYMFSNAWGAMLEIPVANRSFGSTDDSGNPTGVRTATQGDLQLLSMYTGFSDDGSTGLVFGLKFPTGRFNTAGFDRDTQVGTGSTDLILGGYHLGGLNADNTLAYFLQARVQIPIAIQDHYHPGSEYFAVAGLTYDLGPWLFFDRVAPVVQLIAQHRESDRGANAFPQNSGLNRLLVGPGIDLRAGRFKLFADVEFPVHQWVRGNQLVAPLLYRLQLTTLF
jgi:hypothetical protein